MENNLHKNKLSNSKQMVNDINLWKIPKNASKLFHIDKKLAEKVDLNRIRKILRSGYNKTYTSQQWLEDFHVPFRDVRSHLHKLQQRIRNGFLYSTAQVPQHGRATFKGHLSLSQLPNEVRQALSHRITIDYDMENAQPVELLEICKKMGIPEGEYNHLRDLCKNRSEWFEDIGNFYFENYKRKNVKVAIIVVCFFGGSI